MEARKKRTIQSGLQYDHLFPAADMNERMVKKGATVSDTVRFIPQVVRETLPQTEKIAEMLRGANLSETCRNIWQFVYGHIAYHKDEDGIEQIRSPARTWADRHRGVDCDCYTVFISSILLNLKIPHRLRIARYKKDHFQHIYPIVPRPGGKHITIDCVVDYFNYEEPYTEIKDTPMDLQYLSGTEMGDDLSAAEDTDFYGMEDGDELGRKKKGKGKLKQFFKKALHVVNRVNPATVLLRNGVLAGMKLNIMKIAQRLKYAYLSDAEAAKRNIDMGKFQKLKQVKDKIEKIFYGAGGKPENFKKAILTGKGNKNREVSGLGYDFSEEMGILSMNEATPLSQLLGEEMFHSENAEVLPFGEDLGGALGEPATAASITAATGVLAAIAGLLKGIGNIFKKKEKGSGDFESTGAEDVKNLPAEIEQNQTEISKMDATATTDDPSGSGDGDTPKEGFWEKNKKWLKPTLFTAGGVGLLYAGYRLVTGRKQEAPAKQSLSGTKGKSEGRKPKSDPAKSGAGKKDAVKLV